MNTRKFLNIVVSLMVLTTLVFGGSIKATAMPMSLTDETKVPHYFGPNPNWAKSPFTLPDAVVGIDPPKGIPGIQAEGIATVGMNGIITDITVTNPGDGYTTIPKVTITGSGTGATAKADIAKKGVVTAITVDPLNPGAGYTQPVVVISGGSAAVQATATAYGGVDNVALITAGSGYTFPTVDFDLPDAPDGTQATGHAVCMGDNPLGPGPFCVPANPGDTVTIVSVAVDNPGSGYSKAPGVVIRNGTLFDPIAHAQVAEATATLSIQNVVMDTFGVDYKSVPTVTIDDVVNPLTITPASATATVDTGGVVLITITDPGSGYITKTGIKKFTDPLPGLCAPPNCPTDPTAKYIPLAVAEAKTYNGVEADEYEIAVVQYRTSFSSSLKDPVTGNPVGTLVRGYAQLETPANAAVSQSFPLYNEMLDGTRVPIMKPDGTTPYLAVTPPQYLGPTIVATKDKAVRIVFRNLLPNGAVGGDLFLPVESTIMGSGEAEMNNAPYDPRPVPNGDVMDGARNPMCTDTTDMGGMMREHCFTDNRATLHLHGGNTPWISDGTVHQWITPAGETTMWPEGISVENVPDMDVCGPAEDGCMTFYYTNQQRSARLMFYHDHSWCIPRLNVYAGEAAGYLITDEMEQKLTAPGGALAGLGSGIPLVIQDKTLYLLLPLLQPHP